jgi:uncharacterized protein YsxB (DUF464 family)
MMTTVFYVVAALVGATVSVLIFYLLSAIEEVQGDIEEQRKFTQYLHTRIKKLEGSNEPF